MEDTLFYVFASLTLISAFMVVSSRNAVNGAMFMIVAFVGMSALFVLLKAFFLAALQVLVYAGAVVVLFLFIIMLLDVESPVKIKPRILTLAASALAFVMLVFGVVTIFSPSAMGAAVELPTEAYAGLSRNFAYELFTKYMLPFQVTGFLLLVAMIGVILLSKRRAAETETEAGS